MHSSIAKTTSNSINYLINGATQNKLATFIIASTSIYAVYYFYNGCELNNSTFNNKKSNAKNYRQSR